MTPADIIRRELRSAPLVIAIPSLWMLVAAIFA